MINYYNIFCFFVFCSTIVSALPYQDLVPQYNRKHSLAMIRRIDVPTLSNLDYAAYSNNLIRFDPEKFKAKPPEKSIELSDMVFQNTLVSPVNSLTETPLSQEEKMHPMAWVPLQNLLWSELKIDDFKNLGSRIISYKWNDPDIFKPYQHIAACYLHVNGSNAELWVKIEFSHWVTFLPHVTDDDKDGFYEIYAKMNTAEIPQAKITAVYELIKNSYQKKILAADEILDWITVLASYWYPTLNTDIVDLSNHSQWPNSETEKKIRRKYKKQSVQNPLAVVRGNPHGKPLYNVFIVPNLPQKEREKTLAPIVATGKKIFDSRVSKNFNENTKRFKLEIMKFGGSYERWQQKNAALMQVPKKKLATLPKDQMGIEGLEEWVFFRKSFDYILAGDLIKQKESTNPLPRMKELKDFLENKNINLLFMVIPNKAEVYFEKTGMAKNNPPILSPYGRKFLSDLQNSGIEVIDLLPHFIQGKQNDPPVSEKEYLYQKQDTHWTNRGIQIAAKLVADRIKQYSWYTELTPLTKEYSIIDTTFNRQGDIVERLPETVQNKYKPVTLQAQKVKHPDGSWYRGTKHDPILLIGDSFTGVFESVDCKNAGIGAHIAAKTGLGVDIITSWGGGPLVRNKMMRARHKDLDAKRVVVYVMVARDLYNYSQGWDKLQLIEQKK